MAKQSIYKSIDSTGTQYRPVSRYIKIRYDSTGENPYFIFNGRRKHLNEIEHMFYPVMVYDKDGKIIVIGGYETICNFGGLLYEVHPDGEAVRAWEEVDTDD